MRNIIGIARFVVKAHTDTFKVFMQKRNTDGTVGREIETIHKIDQGALAKVEAEYKEDLMFLGVDPNVEMTDELFKSLPKGTQVEYKKAQVKRDNRQMAVVKEWAAEKAEEYSVPVCYMGPANVLATPQQ